MIRAKLVIFLLALFLLLHPFSVFSYAQDEPAAETDTSETDTQPPTTIDDLKRAIIIRDKIIRDLLIRMDNLEKKVEGAEEPQEPAQRRARRAGVVRRPACRRFPVGEACPRPSHGPIPALVGVSKMLPNGARRR